MFRPDVVRCFIGFVRVGRCGVPGSGLDPGSYKAPGSCPRSDDGFLACFAYLSRMAGNGSPMTATVKECVMRESPSIVPSNDQDVYLLLDNYGKWGTAWRETDIEATDF